MGQVAKYLETKTLRLDTLSPIHIRAGEGSKDYGQGFLRLNPQFVYLIDTPALQRELFAAGGLDAVKMFADAYGSPDAKKDILWLLRKAKKTFNFDYEAKIRTISKGIIPTPKGNVLMRSALGQYFVPGSSLKGAIKTAVLYHLLNNNDARASLDKFVEEQVRKHDTSPNRDKFKEVFGKQLLVDNFQSIEPVEEVKNPNRRPSNEVSFKDFFRAIKVKDAMIALGENNPGDFGRIADLRPAENKIVITTLSNETVFLSLDRVPAEVNIRLGQMVKIETTEKIDDETRVSRFSFVQDFVGNKVGLCSVIVASLNRENQTYEAHRFTKEAPIGRRKGTDNRIECFEGKALFTICIDHSILDSFTRAGLTPPFADVNSLLKLCKEFAEAQWQEEENYLAKQVKDGDVKLDAVREFYGANKGKATLRIGWGSGMLGTTVDLLLEPERRKELRNKVISYDHINRPLPAPKSRRFLLGDDGHPQLPLGWIRLSEE